MTGHCQFLCTSNLGVTHHPQTCGYPTCWCCCCFCCWLYDFLNKETTARIPGWAFSAAFIEPDGLLFTKLRGCRLVITNNAQSMQPSPLKMYLFSECFLGNALHASKGMWKQGNCLKDLRVLSVDTHVCPKVLGGMQDLLNMAASSLTNCKTPKTNANIFKQI